MDKKRILSLVLFIAYVFVSIVAGTIMFKMIQDCSSLLEYLFYGLISTMWVGFLFFAWILLINYINEKGDI